MLPPFIVAAKAFIICIADAVKVCPKALVASSVTFNFSTGTIYVSAFISPYKSIPVL